MYVKGNFLRNVCIAAAVIGLICCATYASAEHIRDDLPESMKQEMKLSLDCMNRRSSETGSGLGSAYGTTKINCGSLQCEIVKCEIIEFDDGGLFLECYDDANAIKGYDYSVDVDDNVFNRHVLSKYSDVENKEGFSVECMAEVLGDCLPNNIMCLDFHPSIYMQESIAFNEAVCTCIGKF